MNGKQMKIECCYEFNKKDFEEVVDRKISDEQWAEFLRDDAVLELPDNLFDIVSDIVSNLANEYFVR